MGRDAGWFALESGIDCGAHIILIPEIPFTIQKVCDYVAAREQYGKRFTEGIKLPPELKGLSRGGSVANRVGDAISLCAHKEVRVSVLGHIQRGGSPSPCDRVLGTRFGAKATELIANHDFGKMVCLRGESVMGVDIAEAVGHLKLVDPNGELVC